MCYWLIVINYLHRSSYNSFFDKIKDKVKPNERFALEYIDKFKDNFFNDNIVRDISNRMEADISASISFNGSSVGGNLKEENIDKIQTTTSSYVSKELLRQQKEIIKKINEEFGKKNQVRIVISIDDLDKSWLSESSIRYSFINALLDAFKELLDITSVKVLISIRTDILMGIYTNSLRQQEKDLSLIYNISWTKNEIRRILDNRINFLVRNQYKSAEQVYFGDIFNFNVLNERADEYILNRTMLRPRDAINFVNLCLSECDENIEISENMVLSAEEKFYSHRKQALIQEWRSFYPYISDYIDSLSCFQNKIINLDDVSIAQDYLLKQKSANNSDKTHEDIILTPGKLLNVWFVIGCIGIKKSTNLTIFSSFEKSELDITDYNKEFEIHPLFFRV